MLRMQQEIVRKLKNDDDLFGFTTEVLVGFLTAKNAKQFYKSEKDFSDWKPQEQNRDLVIKEMGEYMAFAWEKAIDGRGLSASRSVSKMRAWLWLLGDTELLEFLDDSDNYPQYGKPMLEAISKKYGFPIPEEAYPLDETASMRDYE